MKKMKMVQWAAGFGLWVISVAILSGIAWAGSTLDGFSGIAWGAGKEQIIRIMKEQNYPQLKSPGPGKLSFKGVFYGIPCRINYELIADSFSEASAENFNKSASPVSTQVTFNRIVDLLSKQYGPPLRRGSEVIRGDKSGAIISVIYAEWNFVQENTSDKYRIFVEDHVTSTQKGLNKEESYDNNVHVFYHADSFTSRLKKKYH